MTPLSHAPIATSASSVVNGVPTTNVLNAWDIIVTTVWCRALTSVQSAISELKWNIRDLSIHEEDFCATTDANNPRDFCADAVTVISVPITAWKSMNDVECRISIHRKDWSRDLNRARDLPDSTCEIVVTSCNGRSQQAKESETRLRWLPLRL